MSSVTRQSPHNVIKHKVGMLNLAAELGNVSGTCKVMGFSRDTFYRYQSAMAAGGGLPSKRRWPRQGVQLRDLPPYSPDFDFIEQVFSKMKTYLRKAAKRTAEELWSVIGELIDDFAPDECERYIRNAGYRKSA